MLTDRPFGSLIREDKPTKDLWGILDRHAKPITFDAIRIKLRSEEHTSELQSRIHLVCRDRKSTRLNSSHGYISYAVSLDRKSTRLNSSHGYISYAVFCLKKKKNPSCTTC